MNSSQEAKTLERQLSHITSDNKNASFICPSCSRYLVGSSKDIGRYKSCPFCGEKNIIVKNTDETDRKVRSQRQRLRERDYCKSAADNIENKRLALEAAVRCIYDLADYEEEETVSLRLFKGMGHVGRALSELEIAVDCFKQRAEEIDRKERCPDTM